MDPIEVQSRSCALDKHELCALCYLVTRKTGNYAPFEVIEGKREFVPEEEITDLFICTCPCHNT